jgi:hypothetical protein
VCVTVRVIKGGYKRYVRAFQCVELVLCVWSYAQPVHFAGASRQRDDLSVRPGPSAIGLLASLVTGAENPLNSAGLPTLPVSTIPGPWLVIAVRTLYSVELCNIAKWPATQEIVCSPGSNIVLIKRNTGYFVRYV